MKNLYGFAAALALFVVAVLTGCSKDENPATPDNTDPYISAKVDGQAWNANTRILVARAFDILQISGQWGDEVIQLNLKEASLHTGTFEFSTFSHSASYGSFDGTFGYSTIIGGGGTFTITKHTDTELAGTFEFHAQDAESDGEINITEGKFFVELPAK